MLRRMTGDVIAYTKILGIRPQSMDAYDRAVFAIQDGDIDEFSSRINEVQCEKLPKLLSLIVQRSDALGSKILNMTIKQITNKGIQMHEKDYMGIIESTMKNVDSVKTKSLMKHAEEIAFEIDNDFYYSTCVAMALCTDNQNFAEDIIDTCPEASLENPSLALLVNFGRNNLPYRSIGKMIDKGIGNIYSAELFYFAAQGINEMTLYALKDHKVDINSDNGLALKKSINNHEMDIAKTLMKHGADFDLIKESIHPGVDKEFVAELTDYWEQEINPQDQSNSMNMN